ncbi:hypothetical protein [Mastigocoleus testarum]|uniref:Uncharacterized protein n=1 Tax=Mastigocoleus testarum BC008 TaxID=371196 RepID=A0A0V7ZKY1_9CYAN|nr:hypothetical protein [Mastigocoleus testarum]KST65257.1 hypothetical protein BC008_20920 [Mastigocoleus testarum BC008]
MSDYELNINNFIFLLKNQPNLFSKKEKAETFQLINSQSDDMKSLSNAISDWCAEHPRIDDALADLEEITTNEVTSRGPGSTKVNSKIPKYQLDKRTLLNAIQQSSATEVDEKKNNGKI